MHIGAQEPSHTVGSDESTCNPKHTGAGAIEKEKISFDKGVDFFGDSFRNMGTAKYNTGLLKCFAGKAKSEGGKQKKDNSV